MINLTSTKLRAIYEWMPVANIPLIQNRKLSKAFFQGFDFMARVIHNFLPGLYVSYVSFNDILMRTWNYSISKLQVTADGFRIHNWFYPVIESATDSSVSDMDTDTE